MFYSFFILYFLFTFGTMTLKEFFDKHPEINQAALAKALWPNVKYPNTKLANKLAKTAGQRITRKDAEDINRWVSKHVKSLLDSPVDPD